MVFRGAAKSTIYAIYKAWQLWCDPSKRSLVWSADDGTAGMLTADTINVLRNHPLCKGMLPKKPGAKRFWVTGANDARNASMRAVGIKSNATGARADAVDFDDPEVPGNIETVEARQKLRLRKSDSVHIAVPGAQFTYIGTPHTWDSIYPEEVALGAELLKIPLFEDSIRYSETTTEVRYKAPENSRLEDLYVMSGINKGARLLEQGLDYEIEGDEVVFSRPPCSTVDIASGNAWPERFTRSEIAERRKNTLTLNAWDSQYMLEAKPQTETRLDPDRMTAYEVEPELRRTANGVGLYLGHALIVGAALKWDPASGNTRNDTSSYSVVFQDGLGRRYWHRSEALTGDVAEYDNDGKKIVGGQVMKLCAVAKKLMIPRITVETNGVGVFAPTALRAALKQLNIECAVIGMHESRNKNLRILGAIQPVLTSNMLWAHTSVLLGDARAEMLEWNPLVKEQPDGYLDSLAGAIELSPERLFAGRSWPDPQAGTSWAADSRVTDIVLEE